MDYSSPPGVFDITPEDSAEIWRSTHIWQDVEEKIRRLCSNYGFEEVRTPLFEKTALFLRSSGEESDIVSKELYRFEDKGGRDLSLRAEGTAPLLRSYISWPQDRQKIHSKLYYIAPMFRYDRPQAGRYRQHHQFGVEAIGSSAPEQDAEVIDLLYSLYQRIGLQNIAFQINSLGSKESRKKYLETLVQYYTPLKDKLSADSQRRLSTNPLRILDSKEPQDIAINQGAPSILTSLDTESKDHFEELKQWLNLLKIPYVVNPRLVRGLDYYNKTVFEVTTTHLGAQNSIGAGGRYDGLIKTLGGEDLPAIGFGTGIERIIQTLLSQNGPVVKAPAPTVYLIPLGDDAKKRAFLLCRTLRQAQISSTVDFSDRKLNKIMQRAHQCGAKYVTILGSSEIEKGEIILKEMATGVEIPLKIDELISYLLLEEQIPPLSYNFNEVMTHIKNPRLQELFLSKLSSSLIATKQSAANLSKQLQELKTVIETE